MFWRTLQLFLAEIGCQSNKFRKYYFEQLFGRVQMIAPLYMLQVEFLQYAKMLKICITFEKVKSRE